jgi:hypothetical protein
MSIDVITTWLVNLHSVTYNSGRLLCLNNFRLLKRQWQSLKILQLNYIILHFTVTLELSVILLRFKNSNIKSVFQPNPADCFQTSFLFHPSFHFSFLLKTFTCLLLNNVGHQEYHIFSYVTDCEKYSEIYALLFSVLFGTLSTDLHIYTNLYNKITIPPPWISCMWWHMNSKAFFTLTFIRHKF